MEKLESRIARYRKCSEFLCLRVSHQGTILRNKRQSEFFQDKLAEIVGGIYRFRHLAGLVRINLKNKN